MSKKDYIAIANAIKDTNKYIISTTHTSKIMTEYGEHQLLGIKKLVESLIMVFQSDNDNFDTARFYNYIESDKRYKDFTDR